MRFNRLCLMSALISAILLSLFCSRSDVVTGAGGSVITDVDPTLTDLGRGFALVTLYDYDGVVDSAFSLPAARDPLFGTYMSDGLLIGVGADGDTLAAHAQFRAAGGAPYSAENVWLAGASVYFPAADELGSSSGRVALFPSDTLSEYAPVNRADKRPNDGGEAGAPADNRIGEFSLGGSGGIDSVQLDTLTARRLFEARRSKDTTAFAAAAFSIVDYVGTPPRKVGAPYIVISAYIRKGLDSAAVYDTILSVARYTVFENAEAAKRAAAPYSSQLTRRTAVFRVDAGKILDALQPLGLSGDGCELMNAVAAVRHKPEAAGDSGLSSRDVGVYKAFALDTLLTDEILLNSTAEKNSGLLRGRFERVGTTAPTSPYNTHDFKAALKGAADRYYRGEAGKPYVYVYLRPVADGSVIVWDKPPKVDAVFTPSRRR